MRDFRRVMSGRRCSVAASGWRDPRPATRDPWFGGAESYSSRLAQQSSLPARAEATAAGYETRGEGHSRGNAVDSESGQFSTI